MKPAPALDCTVCRRTIGKTRSHYLTEGDHVACPRCLTRAARASLFPDCPERRHDLVDHLKSTGTRAGIAHVLGLWP